MNNNYNIEKIIDKLKSKGYTNFVTRKELIFVKGHLNKNEYNIYELYPESSKIIMYKKNLPELKLYKINSNISLRHQDILGTMYSLGLNEDTFGDIIKYEESYYIFILPIIEEYLKYNLTSIKNTPIILEEVSFDLSENFKLEYDIEEIIVSSLRIDNIVSTITKCSRNQVLDKFKNNEINLNYDDTVKPTRVLQEQDIFSIRRLGKYKYNRIVKNTKKGGYIIELFHYK